MGADTKDLIIFAHGTGASDLSDTGSKWWQLESVFSNRLNQLLQTLAATAPPFHWSGANSELARRNAGLALLQRLRQIDESGQGYHVVGHSHGGSVIWHALTQSAAQGKHLVNLRSWCSVGTPFLTFAPRWPHLWRWLTAVFVTAVFSALIYVTSIRELPGITRGIWSDGEKWPLIGYFALLSAAAVLWLWALARVLLPAIAKALFEIKLGAPALAAKWYGERWLGLWHPLDEPINSLAGTLGPAPRIAPRRRESALFRTVPVLGLIWDRVLMRAADEFAWRQVTDRAQGADLANQTVLDVGRAPQPLEPGFDPLPRAVVDELTASADAQSIGVVAKVRALLESAYDQRNTETVVDRMHEVLTFQELIHTSYFDNPEMAEIIAAHITTPSPVAGQLPSPLVPGRAKSDANRAESVLPPRGALEFITAIVFFLLPALGLWLSISTVTRAVVTPYTLAYQLESVKDFVTQTRVLAAGNGSKVASLLLGLEAKGLVADPIGILDRIPHDEHRRQAAMRLAYAYGRAGRIKEVQRLLDLDEPEKLREQYQTRIRLLGFVGNASLRSPVTKAPAAAIKDDDGAAFARLLDPVVDDLSKTMKFASVGKVDLAEIAVEQMGLLGEAERSQKILDLAATAAGGSNETTCDLAAAFAAGRALASPATDLRGLLKLCPDDVHRADLKRSVAFRVLAARHVEALYAFAANNEYPFWPPELIEDFLFTAKDEDDLEKKIRAALPDIVLSALTPDQIEQVRHEDSWASRLARNYLGPIAKLARWTREAGAVGLSDALLDVVARQSANSKEPIQSYLHSWVQALVVGGRPDQTRQAFSKYLDYVNSRSPEAGTKRLQALALLAEAASPAGDNAAVLRFGDEVLAMSIPEPSSETAVLIANVADSVLRIDPARARLLLARALDYGSLGADDFYRNTSAWLLMDNLIKAGAIRQARLAATQIGDTDLSLDALLSVIKYFDPSGSYDLQELGGQAADVKRFCEGGDTNPLENSDE